MLERFNFEKVFDLQNSSRTKFYKKFILRDIFWSIQKLCFQNKKNDFEKIQF